MINYKTEKKSYEILTDILRGRCSNAQGGSLDDATVNGQTR